MMEINRARCTCGGVVREVKQVAEESDYNCARGCCGTALLCDRCGTRFVIEFDAPEYVD